MAVCLSLSCEKPLTVTDAGKNEANEQASNSGQLVEDLQGKKRSDIAAYANLLRRCANQRTLTDGKLVHEHLRRRGYDRETFLGNHLVQMYGKCGSVEDACSAFQNIEDRNVFTWNIMISAYAENGHLEKARNTFEEMPQRDVVSWNQMIAAYAQNGQLEDAKKMFDKMIYRDAASWNALVAAYAQNGYSRKAHQMFWIMCLQGTKPNANTFTGILEVCNISEGRNIHAILTGSGLESTLKVATALIGMYGECGSVQEAKLVFDKMPERDVVTWTAMIAAYAQNGHIEEARRFFDIMPVKNVVSFNAMIGAYAQIGYSKEALEIFSLMDVERLKPNDRTFLSILIAGLDVSEGKIIHERIVENGLESNVRVGTALLSMYGMCGSLDNAREVFDKMQKLDIISWNAMIAVYVANGQAKDALKVFRLMDLEGVKPNAITFLPVLDACGILPSQVKGREIHQRAVENGLWSDVMVANALLSMYGRCGNVEVARDLFDKMPERDTLSWNVMITVYGQNGFGHSALEQFSHLCLEGFEPDVITFTILISACSHAGLLEKGRYYFVFTEGDWGIKPTEDHYLCMIDLLARAGKLVTTEDLIDNMPFEPVDSAWRAFLGGCRSHRDTERAERAAQKLLALDPEDSSTYVLMSNMYAAAGDWANADRWRKAMLCGNALKLPGLSCIEVKGEVHTFAANDSWHPQRDGIYAKVESLIEQIKEEGYQPDIKAVLHNVSDEEKLQLLLHHSEKLAITFGHMNTPSETPLYIMKNLRVCSDCHSAAKFISKVTRRRIVMRDTVRFHHFEHGSCSCNDFW